MRPLDLSRLGAVIATVALVAVAASARPAPWPAFNIDGVEISLRQPDDMTYEELSRLLRAIKNRAIVWTDTTLPRREIRRQDIDHIGVSGPPRLYHIFLRSPQRPTIMYFLDAEFDGSIVTVTRSSIAIR